MRICDAFDKQSVLGGNLVQRRCHQGTGGKFDTGGERTFYAGDNHIEIIKGTDCNLACAAAFGRLRIDIIEVSKPGRVFHFAENRKSVPPDRIHGLRRHSRKTFWP